MSVSRKMFCYMLHSVTGFNILVLFKYQSTWNSDTTNGKVIHGVEKPTKQWCFFSLHMIYIHLTIIISTFRSAFFRISFIYLLLKSAKSTQFKNDNSCKMPISCTVYTIFISKVQQPNEKLRLVMCSVTVFEQEIRLNSADFWYAWIMFYLIIYFIGVL